MEIELPHYVTLIEPHNVLCVTRNNKAISKGNDKLKFKYNVVPKINSFKNSFFVRTLTKWNEIPLNIREIDSLDKFTIALKDHLWLILDFEPD